jgi:cyclohexyl-isocyanide hydratase
LLRNRKATTHWASHHLLSYFGAYPQKERVVFNEPIVTAAGVTSGVDGALQIVAHLRGAEAAQRIQLYMEYAPEPPFDSGDPATAPTQVAQALREELSATVAARRALAEQFQARETSG